MRKMEPRRKFDPKTHICILGQKIHLFQDETMTRTTCGIKLGTEHVISTHEYLGEDYIREKKCKICFATNKI